MVVVLMSADGGRASAVGRALADALGWRRADARDARALHVTAATVLERREPLIVATPVLRDDEQAIVRGDLRNVRFVDLSNASHDTDSIVRAIRDDFGL